MRKNFYTITEAVPIFGISHTTIIHWISLGIIDAKKEKGIWNIDEQSVKNWQEFQALWFPAGDKVIRRRFELASEKNREVIKSHFQSAPKGKLVQTEGKERT